MTDPITPQSSVEASADALASSLHDLRARVVALVAAGEMTIRFEDCDDVEGLAEVRYELRAEGHDTILAALDRGEIDYAYPVVTWRGVEHPGGTVLATEDPLNPHQVMGPVDAVIDSFIGGQLDPIYEQVMGR